MDMVLPLYKGSCAPGNRELTLRQLGPATLLSNDRENRLTSSTVNVATHSPRLGWRIAALEAALEIAKVILLAGC